MCTSLLGYTLTYLKQIIPLYIDYFVIKIEKLLSPNIFLNRVYPYKDIYLYKDIHISL